MLKWKIKLSLSLLFIENFENSFENFAKELNKLLMNLFNISHSCSQSVKVTVTVSAAEQMLTSCTISLINPVRKSEDMCFNEAQDRDRAQVFLKPAPVHSFAVCFVNTTIRRN